MERRKKRKIENDVLVALLPRKQSLEILQSEHWYHIPIKTAPKIKMPPKILAFYQGKVFGRTEAYKIRYYGDVLRIDTVSRKELFPDDEKNQDKANNLYYRVELKSLEERFLPIISHRPRRLVFIPTTLEKFNSAEQINDLFAGSYLEDRMWRALKQIDILAEREWKVIIKKRKYYLDFAVFCNKGKLAIETDGYTYHYDSKNKIDYDTLRQNDIQLDNWSFLHYTTRQIKEDWTFYQTQIKQKIEQLGGLESPDDFNRKIGEERGVYIVDNEEPL